MFRFIIGLLFLSIATPILASEQKLVLTGKSIGGMEISPEMKISLYRIQQHFPFYSVTQRIGQGDSPDFHIFTASTHEGEKLFSFISYIENLNGYEKSVVKLNEIIVTSSKVVDEYGVSIGMQVKDAIDLRSNPELGQGHMDFYVGGGNIWYLHWDYFDLDNPKTVLIDAISWPYPKWR